MRADVKSLWTLDLLALKGLINGALSF